MLKKIVILVTCLFASLMPFAGIAQDKSFSLRVPDSLEDTGFMKHLLPRFSLKTGIRITLGDDASDAAFGDSGIPVFQDESSIWHFASTPGPHTDAFLTWLQSDVGKGTIEKFAPSGTPMFSADVDVEVVETVYEITGDVVLGEQVSLTKCGRCHVVSDANRMNAIGSTPSFALLRGFDDWENRFQAFFVLRPHAAFTQVEDVTEPFPDHLPSPIAPVEVTLDEIDAVVAFVALIEPADLGAPMQSR